jgi:hypothetical protein
MAGGQPKHERIGKRINGLKYYENLGSRKATIYHCSSYIIVKRMVARAQVKSTMRRILEPCTCWNSEIGMPDNGKLRMEARPPQARLD